MILISDDIGCGMGGREMGIVGTVIGGGGRRGGGGGNARRCKVSSTCTCRNYSCRY